MAKATTVTMVAKVGTRRGEEDGAMGEIGLCCRAVGGGGGEDASQGGRSCCAFFVTEKLMCCACVRAHGLMHDALATSNKIVIY